MAGQMVSCARLANILLIAMSFISSLRVASGREQQPQPTEGRCVFGQATCGSINGADGRPMPIPCEYDGPPKVVDDSELLRRFDELCPHLNAVSDSQRGLCCNADQIRSFLDNVQQVRQFIGTCASCLINFSRLFCDLACNPGQATFVEVTQSRQFNDTNLIQVQSISYTIHESFVEGLFESCKDVGWPAAKINALAVLCGKDCTPHKWVEHLGLKGMSPFEITYRYKSGAAAAAANEDKDYHEDQREAIACNESVGDRYPRLKSLYKSRCSETDCPA